MCNLNYIISVISARQYFYFINDDIYILFQLYFKENYLL